MLKLNIKPSKIPPELRWLWSWLPENGNWFVAGGAVRSIVDKTVVSDIDLFSKNPTSWPDEEMVALLKSNGCRLVFSCPEGLLYTWRHRSGLKIQIILEISGAPETVVQSFDFRACQFAMTSSLEIYCLSRESFLDAIVKRLTVSSITYPHASIRRMFKYEAKGYKISDSEIWQLVLMCAEIPFDLETKLWRRYID